MVHKASLSLSAIEEQHCMASSSGLRKRKVEAICEHNLSIVGGNWERTTGVRLSR